ncbi:MAG: hypothetical protein JXR78_07575, partial [Victivallales bacterium]|nr:hypothetical protein [Victivallales bacterium]
NNFCLASPPPKVKDPREAGTKLCLFMIGATLVAVSFQYAQLRAVDAGLTQNFEQKSNLSKTLASLESQVSSQQQQLERYKHLCELAGMRSSVEDKFLTIIDLLSRYRLKYTKINSIEQQIEGIIISGETHWQPDLSQFLSHFEGELARRDMGLFSEGLKIENEGCLEFKCRISRTPVPR